MGELVGDQVFQVAVAAVEGDHHPVAQALGESSHAFREEGIDDIGALKLALAAVKDDRDAGRDGIFEVSPQVVVGLFREQRRQAAEVVLAPGKVNIEVHGLEG